MQGMTDQWVNRIVGQGEVDPEQLLANPLNWRIHPRVQQDALEGAIEEIGWIDEIIVNQRTGYVLDGHLRVSLALKRDQALVPVKYVDLSEDEEKIAIATIDPITAMAVTDKELLEDLLTGINTDNELLLSLFDDITKNERITNTASPEKRAAWRAYNEKLRRAALMRLGDACVGCGFGDHRVLEIDHIKGGGVEHRKEVDHKTQYRAIRDGETRGYQLLCANCHGIKSYEERMTKHDLDVELKPEPIK